ncbi:diadenylate cyclase [Telmatocola sphagniphila]|uniref:Diadenylate cyclase n=1 Tax=Telmatocola sphagniphila TaxID=1123043 RepID=A0A8E6BB33_9BACT|nr:diadenylate cyclase [Telmatocola sphagniphila]QVL34599.1 diadenylate cyclase [Telmatocola sphagniphila]
MSLPKQTLALLQAARDIIKSQTADAILFLTETSLDWDEVRSHLKNCRLIVTAVNEETATKLRAREDLEVIDIDPEPVPSTERMSLALLKAVSLGRIQPGAHVVVLYNGIATTEDRAEHIDSLSLIHLGEHLERLTAQDLRKLDTQIPLETLKLVIDLASEIGREGREGKPVGVIFVVGDTRKVLSLSKPINFNPFRGYSAEERDLRDRRVREQIKDIAQLDGAIIIGRDGVAVAACMLLEVSTEGIVLNKGFGSRHAAAAAISQKTHAIAVCVSQSSGTVRLFQNGEVVLHIEPLSRPHIWQPFRLETQESEDGAED